MEPSAGAAGYYRSDAPGLPASLRLSVGISAVRKATVGVLIGLAFVVLLPLGVLAGSGLAQSGLDVLAVGGPLMLGFLGLILLAVIAWGVSNAVRNSAYLQGTELVVRKALRTQRVDLATARVLRLTQSQSGWHSRPLVPTLEARDDVQQRSLMVHFGLHRDGFLPLYEVQALVAAIQAGSRVDVSAYQAERTIQDLHRIAC